MKRVCWLICILCIFSGNVWSQLASDVNDRLYTWITIWEEKGYVGNLSPLRPYPIQLVKKILEQVKQAGSPEDIITAEAYLKQINVTIGDSIPNRSLPAPLTFSIDDQTWTKIDNYRSDALASLIIQGILGDYFSFSGKVCWGGMIASKDFHGPEWLNIIDESVAAGGVLTYGGMDFWAKNIGVGGLAVGTADLYFQAGLMRSSFGPFFENGAVIGPQCPAAGHFSLNYLADWITVSSIMLVVNPLYYWDYNAHLKEDLPAASEEYVIIHSYTFHPWEWLDFGIVQSVVTGGRFTPTYLIPFVHLFFAQQLYGDDDNSYIGFFTKIKLPLNMEFKFMCYIDDFDHFSFFGQKGDNGLFSLNSAQNKVALQAGITWTPDMEILKRISLDYLMVTPYTYTHYEKQEINYLMYTHEGQGIGTILEPNSDQITLSVFLQPVSFCNINLGGRFARHGNASEDYPYGDGSYYDDGFDDDSDVVTFDAPARFLTQDVLEYVLQISIRTEFIFGLGWGELSCGAGYMFEYVENKNLIAGNHEFNNFFNVFLKLAL
jgi:hypothetical protein